MCNAPAPTKGGALASRWATGEEAIRTLIAAAAVAALLIPATAAAAELPDEVGFVDPATGLWSLGADESFFFGVPEKLKSFLVAVNAGNAIVVTIQVIFPFVVRESKLIKKGKLVTESE